MHSLHEMQMAFASAIDGDNIVRLAPYVVAQDRPVPERIGVYRNNVQENFTAALAATYPVLRRLAGDRYFRQLAARYRRRCPLRKGNLAGAGEQLPEYLQQQFGGGEYDYFADVARLEWACESALMAPECARVDPSALAAVSPEDYARLQLQLHPSVRLLCSEYPVLRIWQQNQPDTGTPERIDLLAGGDCLLVRRDGDGLALHRLDAVELAFLEAVASRCGLAEALDVALNVSSDLDLTASLQYWVSQAIVVGWSLDSTH